MLLFKNCFFLKKRALHLIEIMICKRYKLLESFIFMLGYLLFRVEPFTPVGRYTHSSALVEKKLYFFGGYNGGKCSNEVFYLDLSRSFNIATPPWIDLTQNAKIPFRSCWGTVSLNDK